MLEEVSKDSPSDDIRPSELLVDNLARRRVLRAFVNVTTTTSLRTFASLGSDRTV